MDSNMYLKLMNLLKDFNNPAALNAAGMILLFYEMYEDSYRIFLYNSQINKDEDAKDFLEQFKQINKYIEEFNIALDLAKQNNFKAAENILKIYLKQGIITISGINLLMICYIINKKNSKFKELNGKLKEIDINLNLEKYLVQEKLKRNKMIAITLAFSTIVVAFYVGQAIKKTEIGYKELPPKKEVAYKYIEDASSKELKEVLKDDLEKIFYNKGLNFYKKKDYINAYKSFKLANEYTSNSYLKQHSLFLLAKTANYLNSQDAILYYKEYINQFKGGCYYNEALYDLALLLHQSKDAEAQKYAKEIEKSSIYFNTKVKEILGGGK